MALDSAPTALVSTNGLTKRFPVSGRGLFERQRWVHAVDNVSLKIFQGRTLALVGESGSGKTTLGQMIAGLLEPSGGSVEFGGVDLVNSKGEARRQLRRDLQFIFQDPFSSLNPRHTIRTILSRPFEVHTVLGRTAIDSEVTQLLNLVGLGNSATLLNRHPHQFSGGQRQRIVFARAIALRPRFIVADEPVSSLDMSVKAQLLTLLRTFQGELGLTYLFVTHELAVVRTIAQDVAVMYLGRVVERAPTTAVFDQPLHPYTVALLGATPLLDPVVARSRKHLPLVGPLPSSITPPSGCHFHTRCPFARDVCATKRPPLRALGERQIACHFVGDSDFPLTANLPRGLVETARASAESYAPASTSGLVTSAQLTSPTRSAVPDSGVQECVGNVGEQIRRDHDQRDEPEEAEN